MLTVVIFVGVIIAVLGYESYESNVQRKKDKSNDKEKEE